MPDDHSAVEPPLPIPNRTVKRRSADDSEHSLVKVGHRQATYFGFRSSASGGCFSRVHKQHAAARSAVVAPRQLVVCRSGLLGLMTDALDR